MESLLLGAASAAWLGILTSISPCPLATNIAAISYIGKRVGATRQVLLAGLVYMLGRVVVYLALGMILVTSLLSIPDLAYVLQKHINVFLGPILIVAGVFLLGIIPLNLPSLGISERMQRRAERYGIWGAGLLGMLFALSFCPVSAALFFGSLIPLSVQHSSNVLMPTLYGIGTGLPVILFAFLVAMGTRFLGVMFNRLTAFEKWARRVTAVLFILVGIYYCLIYIFGFEL